MLRLDLDIGAGLELLAGVHLQVLDAQGRGLVHGLEEGEPTESPALQRQLHAELLGSRVVARLASFSAAPHGSAVARQTTATRTQE